MQEEGAMAEGRVGGLPQQSSPEWRYQRRCWQLQVAQEEMGSGTGAGGFTIKLT